jgi:rhodanese-related sulfurtransferase
MKTINKVFLNYKTGSMKDITVDELKQKMEGGGTLNLIDCREPHEYAESNIAGGRLFPLGKIQTMQTEELDDLKERRSSFIAVAAGAA